MKFVVLEDGRSLRVVAHLLDGEGNETLLERQFAEFVGFGGPISKSVSGMLALFKIVSEHGRAKSTRLFHEANKQESIYEFVKGDIRVYFFFSSDSRELVVCSHAIRKKKQKADSSDIAKVASLRERMNRASDSGQLKFIERGKKT